MATVKMYIGSNNATHVVETAKVKRILNKYHQGWTMQNALGSWLGTEEDSVTVLVSDDFSKIKSTIEELKTQLKQDAIAYQVESELEFI